ncbi:hypothetical protein Back11_32740 [Paenibacillus baekrokdamisoli]|uniref:Uncharacterized protein n=1 Tax=Paenibacillus baekrokdamisoli TaxID=1712516 RepID=A0A3G9JG30_9BACL|nr:hypothetical protein [Paenibacillus baekrokdamisoli]MBB3071559.1 hypothetical protein [Paenibacillus baekrokdamisoli]BBH21929.1 hypothetical protein Back11_32740 [Paenibacillus baekrokdamisoli]
MEIEFQLADAHTKIGIAILHQYRVAPTCSKLKSYQVMELHESGIVVGRFTEQKRNRFRLGENPSGQQIVYNVSKDEQGV